MRLITILLALAVAARANLPPDKPTITEPKVDGRTVNSEDVHMETAAFSDPDPGDTHASSDWEIWTVGASAERVWAALAKTGVERVHLHFGDGVFEHSLAGQRALTPETDYELRARHRDAAGAVSEVAVRAFRTLPKPARVPGAEWLVLDLDYAVEVVATGFQLPVNIAFVPQPTFHPGDPLFYVTELYGTIKVMTTDGTVSDYATGLLNFPATGNFPGDGEQGLAGIAVDAATGDIFASLLYLGGDGEHHPKVVRFHSNDGGLTAATQTTILDMAPEVQGQSHQVSNLSFGPDGKLYVHMGDGFETATSRDLKQYRGKILRMNLNGTPARGNPFLNARDGITSKDFVFAYGFRNPFGGAWRALDRAHYTVENGPGVDRFSRTRRSKDYRFDGSDGSMSRGALYNWDPAVGPVNVAFIQPTVFGGSGFPRAKWQHAFVTQSGGTYATGPQDRAKMITEFAIDRLGRRVSGPVPLVSFNGAGRASCAALAAGPDGLYFSDLYRDAGNDPTAGGARILRVRYLGAGDFTALPRRGAAPLEVQFIDTSAGGSDWQWDFGDGATSTEQSPAHTYAADGAYTVQLRLADGRTVRKDNFVIVGDDGGLTAEYFAGANLEARVFTRLDPTVNFEWGGDAPDPRLAPDSFSVRWRGKVTPAFSETYTFTTVSDDGARLWVNGKKLVDHWIAHAPTEDSATIALVAGRSYDVRMEMYEAGGGAVAQLLWSSASVPRQAVPASALTPLAEPFALPDAAIAAVRPVTFAGINRANTSAIGQTLTQRAAVDQERSFHVKIRNRGRGTDWIVVQGAAGTPGFHTHYFADEDDVTNAVTNGTYAISLAAGASRVLRVEVTPNATTAAGDAFHARVQVTASADATRTDVVDGVVVRQ